MCIKNNFDYFDDYNNDNTIFYNLNKKKSNSARSESSQIDKINQYLSPLKKKILLNTIINIRI